MSAASDERPAPSALRASFLKFVLAGAVGYLIDASVLTLLVTGADWTPWRARLVSYPLAVTATWWINRRYAFGDSRPRRAGPRAEYAAYFGIQTVGAALNLAIFAACLHLAPGFARWPVVPLTIASAIALFFNFGAARALLYTAPAARRP